VPGAEYRDRVILSVSGTGRVSELRLRYLFPYRLTDNKGRDVVPPASVELVRDLTYDDSQVLAKQQEETLLWRDMETGSGATVDASPGGQPNRYFVDAGS
jgi:LPS-assembly lipoprotein